MLPGFKNKIVKHTKNQSYFFAIDFLCNISAFSNYDGGVIFFGIDDNGAVKDKRNDTATIEVDTLEFSRLILEGRNIRFEELPWLLADKNDFHGIDIVKFGENISIIQKKQHLKISRYWMCTIRP